MENVKSNLFGKLNTIIEEEMKKEPERIDDILVHEAVDARLRMIDETRYQISSEDRKTAIRAVLNSSGGIKSLSKTAKILLVAAIIIILLLVSAFAFSIIVGHTIEKKDTHSVISFNISQQNSISSVEVTYIPDGFELIESDDKKTTSTKDYMNNQGIGISILKSSHQKEFDINTEYSDSHSTVIDEIEYVIFGEAEHGKGVTFAKNNCVYLIVSPLPDDELLKIAQGVS